MTLAEMRCAAGFGTQEKLAKQLETNRVNVARWETGSRFPRPNTMMRLASTLGVSEGEIMAAISEAREAHQQGA